MLDHLQDSDFAAYAVDVTKYLVMEILALLIFMCTLIVVAFTLTGCLVRSYERTFMYVSAPRAYKTHTGDIKVYEPGLYVINPFRPIPTPCSVQIAHSFRRSCASYFGYIVDTIEIRSLPIVGVNADGNRVNANVRVTFKISDSKLLFSQSHVCKWVQLAASGAFHYAISTMNSHQCVHNAKEVIPAIAAELEFHAEQEGLEIQAVHVKNIEVEGFTPMCHRPYRFKYTYGATGECVSDFFKIHNTVNKNTFQPAFFW